MKILNIKGAVVLTAAALMMSGASSVSAATYLNAGTCSISDVTPEADACFGQLQAAPSTPAGNGNGNGNGGTNAGINDTNVNFNTDLFGSTVEDATAGLFGYTDWNLDPVASTLGEGDDPYSWTSTFNFTTVARAFLVIKGGNSFSTYLFDVASTAAAGTFTTAGLLNNGGQMPDLSHFEIYVGGLSDGDGDSGGPVSPVPLPAGLPMLASAFGLAVFLRKRRS